MKKALRTKSVLFLAMSVINFSLFSWSLPVVEWPLGCTSDGWKKVHPSDTIPKINCCENATQNGRALVRMKDYITPDQLNEYCGVGNWAKPPIF
ncbi:hypothetical protein A3F66_06435 [candidate division TM6 bacterium RIFCSPHIGHO2_12_FULL_32_22]|nr:MAG: hypothetical protein A3F66_06435 [candidate division TM6 bacterium RIFCSPHIGHO2_12_FULL_32_22]